MNHCLLEVTVKGAPTIRYTQDNKTAIAEMDVAFDGLRAADPPGQIKVVGWGNLAQELQNRAEVGQKLVIEGRLRMTTVPRQDGTKEKRAEFTLSRMHASLQTTNSQNAPDISLESQNSSKVLNPQDPNSPSSINTNDGSTTWNSAPLIPDTDDIPF